MPKPKSRKERLKALDRKSRSRVLRRDNGKCFLCKVPNKMIHEVVSKSQFGTRLLHICMQPRNRVVLCQECHNKVQGKANWITYLLELLEDRFGYKHPEQKFQKYLREE